MTMRSRLDDLAFGQWWLIAGPFVGASIATFAGRKDLDWPTPLYFIGGGLAFSLLIGFVMLDGDEISL
jgi:hypothetical protein